MTFAISLKLEKKVQILENALKIRNFVSFGYQSKRKKKSALKMTNRNWKNENGS